MSINKMWIIKKVNINKLFKASLMPKIVSKTE